jgi:predicted HTH transcriptional regulator
MKDLRATRGRYIIHDLIEQGENEHQDFKYSISDARKIARSVSAFANNDGGCLLIGVKDNGAIAGVRNEEDIYVVEQAAQMYCTPPQEVKFDAFKVEGLMVIRATVAKAEQRPVQVLEADGRRKAYFRVADENISAHPLMVRAWQKQHDNEDSIFSLSEAETSLLNALDEANEPLSTSRLPMLLHASQRATDDIVVRLAAMDIISFVYVDQQFKIIRNIP